MGFRTEDLRTPYPVPTSAQGKRKICPSLPVRVRARARTRVKMGNFTLTAQGKDPTN